MAGPGSTAPSSSGSWMASWISSSQITTGSTGSDTLCDIVCSDFLAAEEVFQKLLNPLLQINLRYGITVHCHPCTPRATAQLKTWLCGHVLQAALPLRLTAPTGSGSGG